MHPTRPLDRLPAQLRNHGRAGPGAAVATRGGGVVRCALWWAVLAALLLAGCDTNSSRRSSLVSSVRVLSAAAEGTVAAITETSVSGIDENGDPYTGSFRTWQVYRGEDRLKGLESFELQPYPDVLSAVGPDGTLWWAQDLPLDAAGPRRVQLCFQRSGEEPGCQSAAFSNPDAIAGVALHALALDDEGDAVLLAGGAGQWLSLSMPARAGAAARRHDLSIPAEAVDPRLMHGAQGATVTWYEPGLGLRLLRMSDPARGWQAPDHPGRISTPVWAAAQQRGVGGRFWLFACSDVGPGFVPEMAMLLPSGVWQSVSAPPALGDCASLVDPPLLAVSDNGDALLAWTDGVATPWMAAHRDAATGTWSEPVAFEPDVSPRRLVADELGHFALLSFDGSVFEPVLRLRAYAPHAGWQPAMVVDQDRAAQGEGDVAASQGRAVVAWARYVTTGTEVQSLLADASFDLASNLAPLGVQIEGDAGGLASVVSTPAGIACPGDCRLDVPPGSPVTLEARPGAGQRFAGWSGICRSDDARVTIDVPAGGGACTARFEPQAGFALTLQVQGNGSISTNPPGPAYPPSTVVTLTATPGAGQRFVAWGGDADCADGQVTMDAPRHCNAAFEPDPALAAMTLEVSGGGRVTSTPRRPGLQRALQRLLSARPERGAQRRATGRSHRLMGRRLRHGHGSHRHGAAVGLRAVQRRLHPASHAGLADPGRQPAGQWRPGSPPGHRHRRAGQADGGLSDAVGGTGRAERAAVRRQRLAPPGPGAGERRFCQCQPTQPGARRAGSAAVGLR